MSRKRRHEDASEEVFVFYANTNLSSIPSDITSLRIDSSVKKIPYKAFRGQKSLTNVEYQEGLEVIGERAFEECSCLREQQFPSTLIEIGKHAFFDCEQLESVGSLPLGLTIIREYAFLYCEMLEDIEIPNGTICLEQRVFACCCSLTHCRLPRGMVTIPAGLFDGCFSLVDVNVPLSVIEIGGRAFFCCEKLAMIELPAGLKTIGDQAFHSTGLEHFHCPAKVESIGDRALSNCKSLESVILPPKLEVISDSTFASCYKLKEISIPQSVVRIGKFAFANCGLTQLDFSRCNIMSIGKSAFAGCSDLKSAILPRTSLKRIEVSTFNNCWSLTHLWIPPTVEYIEDGAFADCISLISVEVPETLKRFIFVSEGAYGGGCRCGYKSLANIYLPPSHELNVVDDYDFMKELKLSEAEGSYPELIDKLKRRFNLLPLHRACYFQSYHSHQENIEKIRSIVRAGPGACEEVDCLGMNPFHILALSQRPWLNLFQELLSVSSVDILKCQDVFGSTPMDYLCKNHSSAAVCVTKSLLVILMEPRISVLGQDCWRDDVMSCLQNVQMADARSLGAQVASVCRKLEKFERMEVLSLLEMCIWRMKVEEEKGTGSDVRESCRINCGSSIVLENVRPFLGTERPTP